MFFLCHIWLSGLALSFLTAPLGCVLLWRRLTFFADSFSHGALFGVFLSFLLGLPLWIGFIVTGGIFIGIFLVGTKRLPQLPSEIWLAIGATGGLALGVLLSQHLNTAENPMHYLFGNFLSITTRELFFIFLGAFLINSVLFYYERSILLTTIDEDLAAAEGIKVRRIKVIVLLLATLGVSLSLKVIGGLLVPGLLIIPATIARFFSTTPRSMIFQSVGISALCISLGMLLSFQFHLDISPTIVLVFIVGVCFSFLCASKKSIAEI